MEALLAEVVDIRNPSCAEAKLAPRVMTRAGRGEGLELTAADENLVGAVFVSQLRSITLPGFLRAELDPGQTKRR